MRILMFTWEFPPLISGGLGTACYGIVKALLKLNIEVDLVLPTKEEVYFSLRKESDVDTLPIKFLSPQKNAQFVDTIFKTVYDKLEYIGMSSRPESYKSVSELNSYYSIIESVFKYSTTIPVRDILHHITGDGNIFNKVKEFTQRAEKYSRMLRYDIIHMHDWLTYPAGIIAKSVSGKKLVAHIHATEFDRSGGGGNEHIHKIEYAGLINADKVIAVSKYTSEMVTQRYRIDTAKLHIVYNAHNIENKSLMKKRRISKYPTILFLGRITLQKGPDYFLEAARIVLSKYPNVQFIMAGNGDMENQILHKSASYKLKNRFLFAGFLDKADVEEIFSASDIYVLSSVSEPFGIAPLEAMSYCVATIISKQSGVSEIIQNAIKIDFWNVKLLAETIIKLIEDPEYRKDLATKGKKEVEGIKWEKAAQEINAIYEEVI